MQVTIYPADVNLLPGAPHLTQLTYLSTSIEHYFSAAAGPNLEIALDWSRRSRAASVTAAEGLSADDLQAALALVLPGGAQTSVGLLLADILMDDPVSGLDSSQYGFMFDPAGDTAAGLGPRLGCALFLTPIQLRAQAEGLNDAQMQAFIAFTAIHELGHVFNLWHSQTADTFMIPHPDPGAPLGHTFDPLQTAFLRLCDDAAHAACVAPGASSFGDRPSGFPQGPDVTLPFEGPPPGLDLKISLSHETFWSFEPVELFVDLSGRDKTIVLADEPHPNFPAFDIWITRPSGERVRYLPDTAYCRPARPRTLAVGETLHREVWIGRQAGGLTFAAPGVYQLQAQFAAGPGPAVRSNVVSCEVRAADPAAGLWRQLAAFAASLSLQTAMRFKRGVTAADYALVEALLGEDLSGHTRQAIHYAMGLALHRAAAQRPALPPELWTLAQRHLAAALDEDVNPWRRARITPLIA